MGARMFLGDKEIHGLKSYKLSCNDKIIAEGKFDDFRIDPERGIYVEGQIYNYIERNSGRKGQCKCIGEAANGQITMEMIS